MCWKRCPTSKFSTPHLRRIVSDGKIGRIEFNSTLHRIYSLLYDSLLTLLVIILCSIEAKADIADFRLETDFTVGAYSDYLSRGRLRDDGPSLQPSFMIGAELKDDLFVSAGLWGHLPIGSSRIAKLEPYWRLDYTVAGITGSLGQTFHTFPKRAPEIGNDEDDSGELFGGISFDTALSPQLMVHYDYDRFDSVFVELITSHRIEYDWGKSFVIVPNFNVGALLSDDERYESTGWTYLNYGIFAEFQFGRWLLIPSVNYNSKIDGATANRWYGGIAVNISDILR